MIVSPTNTKEWNTLAHFLLVHAGVQPSTDLKMLGWVTNDQVQIVVGMNGFLGKVAQIHIAMEYGHHFTPKSMLKEVFKFAFETCKLEMLLGVVNSDAEEVVKYDLHLGFKELYRIPGMHENGGDIILLGMRREECRYLRPRINGTARVPQEA